MPYTVPASGNLALLGHDQMNFRPNVFKLEASSFQTTGLKSANNRPPVHKQQASSLQ